MLMVNKLKRAGKPLSADEIFEFLEKEGSVYFSYPSDRVARMRQLQRDIHEIADLFCIEIKRFGKSSYYIASYVSSLVDYDRLFAEFDLLTALNPESGINKYVIPERSRNRGSQYLHDILSAIKKRVIIEFDYVNYRAGCSERHHKIAPHFLKEDQGLWYVIGKENEKPLIFALDRIKNLTETEEGFRFDESLDIENWFKDSYGIWTDSEIPTQEIELRYDALDGSFLKARPLHPSQKVIIDNPDEFRITVRLKITNDFIMALLSRSRSLEVIRPLPLRQRIHGILTAALARNS